MVPADKWWGSAESAVGARITDISQGRARFQGAVCVKSCLGDGWQCTQSLIFGEHSFSGEGRTEVRLTGN